MKSTTLKLLFFCFNFAILLIPGKIYSQTNPATIPADPVLNEYIEYLATKVKETSISYKLLIENGDFLLNASYYTYSNYQTSNSPLPEECYERSNMINYLAGEIDKFNSQYIDYNAARDGKMQAADKLLETGLLQEYIELSNSLMSEMSTISPSFKGGAQSQYEIVRKIWAKHVARETSTEIPNVYASLREFNPDAYDETQEFINTGLKKQMELYYKLVDFIQQMEGVEYDRTFVIANQQRIREEIEKKENEALELKRKELESVRVSSVFSIDHPAILYENFYYNTRIDCKTLDDNKHLLREKGYSDIAIDKMLSMCGQFNENIPRETLNKLKAYYITDLSIYDHGQRTLLWVPKDENDYLLPDEWKLENSEGFILLGSYDIAVTGKVNPSENNTDTLEMGKLFRNPENRSSLPLNHGRLRPVNGGYENEIRAYLKTFAGNNAKLDSLLTAVVFDKNLPPCVADIGVYHVPKAKKKDRGPKDCEYRISYLTAYKLLQFYIDDKNGYPDDYYNLYWIPGDENNMLGPDIKPLTPEGFGILVKGLQDHFYLKRKVY